MARFNVTGIDDLISRLDRIGDIDSTAPEMLNAGMEKLQKEVVEEASKHKDTGDMIESIKPTKVSKSASGGYYICTRPTGYDRKKVRNMEKLVWLELGVKGRPATPVITAAVIRAEPEVLTAMRAVFEWKVMEL